MYAFYSLLIYIFYSLFRRDGGAAAAAEPGDPAQGRPCPLPREPASPGVAGAQTCPRQSCGPS